MDTSFTENPLWIKKMKWRFALLDVDKNGIFNPADLAIVAKNLVAYRNEGLDQEKHYFEVVKAISLVEEKGSTEKEFIERAKIFVSQPNCKDCVKRFVDAIFKIMDTNKDGVISYEEFLQFHKSFNIEQEMIDMLFNKADTNRDVVIDYQETHKSFVKFFFTA